MNSSTKMNKLGAIPIIFYSQILRFEVHIFSWVRSYSFGLSLPI